LVLFRHVPMSFTVPFDSHSTAGAQPEPANVSIVALSWIKSRMGLPA